MNWSEKFSKLAEQFEGDFFDSEIQRVLYSTDASSYREKPLAVARPKNKEDIQKLILFANEHQTSIIPRAAGTSLAGQVVGGGIVVDISKYMNRILEFNPEERWILVEPGVNLAELNKFLAPSGLLFGPETSTANRCCIGGMLGNNSCGLRSLIYGSTREHVIEVEAILSDGSEAAFGPLSASRFEEKCNENSGKLETAIYQNIKKILTDPENQKQIRKEYPHPSVLRRNTGYALDVLLNSAIFSPGGKPFNFCKLLAGSEGTLAFSTAIKLNLVPQLPKYKGVVCAHFSSLQDAFKANIIALKYHPTAIEMMDDKVLECTKSNIEQQKNRFFVKGDPKAMLMIEFAFESEEELFAAAKKMEINMLEAGYGYHFPLVTGADKISRIWELRRAGLGLLSNIPGDKSGVTIIEDTAVAPEYLPDFMDEFQSLLDRYKLDCVYYAHIDTGELHLRPLLDLKNPNDRNLYHQIGKEVALLVKKYKGSLSGEHGDGRLRGTYIPLMLGEHNYNLLKEIKKVWDPYNVLNPGKIVDTPLNTGNLRFQSGQKTSEFNTTFDFSATHGMMRAIEKCNGTAACRKSEIIGGTMCPTFMATRDEDKSTRARANILREYLTYSGKENPFDHKEIYEILDLCLSCKACKAECPSNVDMAKLKAEFLHHYYEINGIPLRAQMIAYLPVLNPLLKKIRPIANALLSNRMFKSLIGFHPERSIPAYSKRTLNQLVKSNDPGSVGKKKGKVFLFNDEFTNYYESDIGLKAVLLLAKLGYEVSIPRHRESGRTFLSKGLLKKARAIAEENVLLFKNKVSDHSPLLGIEPSAILTFRDEYPELVRHFLRKDAAALVKNTLLFEEFICREIEKGNITSDQFIDEEKKILLHGHCQQKAIVSTATTIKMLSLPKNYSVEEIPSGCCGMAGSFGYEKEHFGLAQKIGEMVLFPSVRKAENEIIISAPGTSCRHHIKDGTGRDAFHPIEIIWEALK